MSNHLPLPDPLVDLRPLADLHDALRRAADELEQCARSRRAHADRARARWRGGRRDEFEAAWADLDAITRRVLADLRTARIRTAAVLDGGR